MYALCFQFVGNPIDFLLIEMVDVAISSRGGNSVCTVVLRGSTDSILDDLERAVDDGVNTYKVIVLAYESFWMGWIVNIVF